MKRGEQSWRARTPGVNGLLAKIKSPANDSPSSIALTVFDCAVETYKKITQVPDAEEFVLCQIELMAVDELTSGATLALALMNPQKTGLPPDRPLPTVVWGVLVSCAYAVQTIKADASGKAEDAWRFACHAQYFCGIARGAAGELVAKHGYAHSADRVAFAALSRRAITAAKLQRLKDWAARQKYAGMSKDEAAAAMSSDGFGLSASRIGKLLAEAFPKQCWKNRHIG